MKTKFILLITVCVCTLFVLSVAMSNNRDYWPTKKWKTSPPEKQGMDAEMLGNMNNHVKEKLPKTSCVLVVRHGYIMFEEYYSGSAEDLRTLHSVAKSVTSALIGIALKEEYLESIDQKMLDFFPEYVSADLNPRVHRITVRHLLSMSSGIADDTLNPDKIKTLFTLPIIKEPGKSFNYAATSAHILSMIITKATELKAFDSGKKYLFEPLGISNIRWEDAFDFTNGSSELFLTSRDMAKIGYLYLNKGKWGKKQILTPEWVEESTRVQMEVIVPPGEPNWDYGFLWWVIPAGEYHEYLA